MFKKSFKYYKSKNPPPNLNNVLDLNKSSNLTESQVKKVNIKYEKRTKMFGLKHPKTWEVFEIVDRPGLIFIKNPFTGIGQRYWTVKCVRDYSKRPNKTNIDGFNLVPENKEWWEMCQSNTHNILLLNKLRWVTLGYHHNWDTKVYSEDNRGNFPQDLSDMTRYIASILGYTNFNPEAAIVNYYHMDSTLSGHTDHSEKDLEAPLFSFSFGQTAIFLLGGKTPEEEPTPIFLRSGDIVVMTKESRLAYHGVPKILQIDSRYWDCVEDNDSCSIDKSYEEITDICKDDFLWKPFGNYLANSRININVRQVLNRGQKRLNSEDAEDVT